MKHGTYSLLNEKFPAKYLNFSFLFPWKYIMGFQKTYIWSGHRRLDFELFKLPWKIQKITFSPTTFFTVYKGDNSVNMAAPYNMQNKYHWKK